MKLFSSVALLISLSRVLAQNPADQIPSGWVGASILSAVLAWLMWIHIPAKDKLLKEMIQAKDEQTHKDMTELTTTFKTSITEIVAGNRDAFKFIMGEFKVIFLEARDTRNEDLKLMVKLLQMKDERIKDIEATYIAPQVKTKENSGSQPQQP